MSASKEALEFAQGIDEEFNLRYQDAVAEVAKRAEAFAARAIEAAVQAEREHADRQIDMLLDLAVPNLPGCEGRKQQLRDAILGIK